MGLIIGTFGDDDGVSNPSLLGTATDDTITGLSGNDLINGDAGNDILMGDGDNDTLLGGTGSDTLDGGVGDDSIDPGDTTHSNPEVVLGSVGNDTIDYSVSTTGFQYVTYDALSAAINAALDLYANTASVNKGVNGTDTLINFQNPLFAGNTGGGWGIQGTAHGDTFTWNGWTGITPILTGGAGGDTFVVTDGKVLLDYSSATSGIVANLPGGTVTDGLGGIDTLTGAAGAFDINGSDFADTLTGTSGDENFAPRGGSDLVSGGLGSNAVSYDFSPAGPLVVDMTLGTVIGTWNGTAFTDTLTGVQSVRGGPVDDSMTGSSLDDMLDGAGGNDTITGQGGRDGLAGGGGDDLIDGGPGDDWLTGDDGNDTLLGGTGGDEIVGGSGNDSINTGSNDGDMPDFIFADTGNDTINYSENGPTGAQLIDYHSIAQSLIVVVDGATNTATINKGTDGLDTFIDINAPLGAGGFSLGGGFVDDTYTLNVVAGQRIQVRGMGGADLFNFSGTGVVGLDYSFDFAGINADLQTGLIVDGSGSTDTINGSNYELRASWDDDTILGSNGDDSIMPGDGSDSIDGALGVDRISYQEFLNDPITADMILGTVMGGAPGFMFTDTLAGIEMLAGTQANDTILGSLGDEGFEGQAGNDSILANSGHDRVDGGDGADYLDGGNGDDTLNGDIGLDTLRGGGNNDLLNGGSQNDSLRGDNGNDTVNGGTGDDYVNGGGGLDSMTGAGGNDTMFGGSLEDIMSGGAGHDTVYGQGGNDTMSGGSGDDSMQGGTGSDSMMGDSGNDTMRGYTSADFMNGGGNNDLIIGDDGNDTLQGATGLDTLEGRAHDDLLTGYTGADRLDGGTGNDTMNGGTDGNRDTFVFDVGYEQDRINAYEQGIDRIELDDALWLAGSGVLTGQEVVDTFGSLNVAGTILTLDFGNGDILEVQNTLGIDQGTLGADIVIV